MQMKLRARLEINYFFVFLKSTKKKNQISEKKSISGVLVYKRRFKNANKHNRGEKKQWSHG